MTKRLLMSTKDETLGTECLSNKQLPWIDSHAHLDFDRFDDDRIDVIERAQARGVTKVISIGTRIDSTKKAIELAESYPNFIYASAGFHPLYMGDDHEEGWRQLEDLLCDPRVVGVGETGLDYYYDSTPPQQQRDSFRRHLQLSSRFNKPIIIHIRDAFDDAFKIIDEEGLGAGGVVHCFTGGPEECQAALDRGLYISLSGIVTFKSAKGLRAATPLIPDDRLLIETDSPFLAPTPHRGERNEPSFVVDTAVCVAALRGQSLERLSHLTIQNTTNLFSLNPPEVL